jgi:hypothetical protein
MPITRPHFSDEEWTDYVRGTLPDARRAEARGHLDAACGSCRKLHSTWLAIQDTTRAAGLHQPSPDTMRIAKAFFGLHRPAGLPSQAAQMVQLLFDSRWATATGFRSAAQTSPKFVYAADPYLVDIQLHNDEHGRPARLIGQVTTHGTIDGSLEGSHVLLMRNMEVIARATMNRIGEFHMDFDENMTGASLLLGIKHAPSVITVNLTRNES